MDRIQLYVLPELKSKIDADAKSKDLTISQCAISVLMQHYGLNSEQELETRPIKEIANNVIEEVEEFVKTHTIGTTFDLLIASKTFKNIQMRVGNRPSTARATIGKIFAASIGVGSLKNVDVVRNSSGKVKKSLNRATLYRIM